MYKFANIFDFDDDGDELLAGIVLINWIVQILVDFLIDYYLSFSRLILDFFLDFWMVMEASGIFEFFS
jgi:hypothetical protein